MSLDRSLAADLLVPALARRGSFPPCPPGKVSFRLSAIFSVGTLLQHLLNFILVDIEKGHSPGLSFRREAGEMAVCLCSGKLKQESLLLR